MINTACIAARGWPPSICHMRVRRGSKTQAGRRGSLGGALGPGGEALGAGARNTTQTKVRIKVSAGRSGGTKPTFCLPLLTPKKTSIPLQSDAHSV